VPAAEEPDVHPAASLDQLSAEDCFDLLATESIGRVGLIVDGRPEVLPVNYVVDGKTIVFRTAEGTVLNQAAMQVVAFEVDHIDHSDLTGWSVLAQGVAQDIGEAIDLRSEELRRLALVTWAPGRRHRWFRVDADRVTGRRLRAASEAP
jgi:nitroimidazol reductase NimA-like FMN-containing flavoprotein (pyridoxamine 5'-phosphate oxidase superfamily)